MVTVQDLLAKEQEINDLAKRVNALVSPPLPFGRVVNFDPAVSATFTVPSLTHQQPTWVNGGSDFWLSGLGYKVWASTYTGQTFLVTVPLVDEGTGFGTRSGPVPTSGKDLFEFQWNMTKQENATGRQISYVAAPGAMNSLLSHDALGNQETNRHLDFRPWKINHGDSLFFTIKPLGYYFASGYTVLQAFRIMTVTITMYGFRVEEQR